MKRVIRWLPAIVWMAVIFALSSRTGDEMGGWLPYFQQIIPGMESFDGGHFVAYFILAWTFIWAIAPRGADWRHKLAVVLMCVAYGFTDEFHQSFVPGRSPDLTDIRNDGIGAALAMLLLSVPFVSRLYRRFSGAKYY